MWSCDGGKFAAIDVTANVFRRTTYTSLWCVCCLDKADGLECSDLNALQFVVRKRRLCCYLRFNIVAINAVSVLGVLGLQWS